ncbi:MAG TPA: hypothetical protein VG406_23680 [Isosphaeraceae bacterium]|jgi:hypothetical protein|nr:hypothetical protein [Isosphaeraceae bacterium]
MTLFHRPTAVRGRELARLAARAEDSAQAPLAAILYALAAAVHLDLDPLGEHAGLDLVDFGRRLAMQDGRPRAKPPAAPRPNQA